MYVCNEHLEIAMDDILADEKLPVINELKGPQKCEYCEAQAIYEIVAQAASVEY